MILTQVSKSQLEHWDLPPQLPREKVSKYVKVCPFVPLKLPKWPSVSALKKAWFSVDTRSWHIKPFRRRAIYKLLKRNMDDWWEWLRIDSSPTFYIELSTYREENDGAVIGVAGPKGSGKSWLSQMVINRCIDNPPHVVFQYSEVEAHLQDKDDMAIGIIIDEDLRATGHESRNLVVHINNAFETSRKAELWACCTGVNLSFEGWGDTLDLRLIPFGYNKTFQATRAAVWSKERDFLGFIGLQRKHLPDETVYYYDEEGTWAEYKPRAIAYSQSVMQKGGATSAVSPEEQDRHIAAFVDYLENWMEQKNKTKPPKNIMCRRLYRKAGLPDKSTDYMKEIIAWAKEELPDADFSDSQPYTGQVVDLQQAVFNRLIERGVQDVHVLYLQEYIDNETQRDIAARYDCSQSAVSQALTAIKQEHLGYAFEDVFAAKLRQEGLLVYQGGDNSPAPDLVTLSEEDPLLSNEKWWNIEAVQEHIEQCYSLKCYLDKKKHVTIPRTEIARSEETLKRAGIPLIFVYYDIYTDTEHIFEVRDQQNFSVHKEAR
jgi:hypothetical protein